MKFQPDTLAGVNHITHVDSTGVRVNGTTYSSSVLVPWTGEVRAWQLAGAPATFDALSHEHFDALLAYEPELVIFGSGTRLRFASPAVLRGLMARRIGFETMDTGAACRTYTVLANEGRRVVGALVVGG